MAWPPEVLEAESPLYEMLRFMVRRPGMYLGERPLERFQGWLDGYKIGLAVAGRTDPLCEALRTGDFNAFVAARLDLPNRFSGENAFKMIAYVSPSQGRGAFEDFVTLLDDFLEAEEVPRTEPHLSAVVHDQRLRQQGAN
ncbi:MAG: hypothetical protein QNJ13_13540 [Paracoccaceae bacterium]|nr:hypothetical protein [Paracoccaceae bacterium]